MSLKCGRRSGGMRLSALLGIVLMAAGALTLLIFVPRWVWTGALAIVMISVGFVLWRFS